MARNPSREGRAPRRRVALRMWLGLAAVVCVLVVGCGGKDREAEPLGFVEMDDTSSVAAGPPLMTRLEPYRMPNGAVRVKGRIDLPDRTRLQLTLRHKGSDQIVGRVHVFIDDKQFDSPPILGPSGPLEKGRYHVEALTFFNDMWQESAVLRETQDGRRLRGAGMTRDGIGDPAYRVVAEREL